MPTEENKQPSASTNDQDTMDPSIAVEDFISTGRTGRRNAVADITDPCVGNASTAGMDFSFDKLSVTGKVTCMPHDVCVALSHPHHQVSVCK